MLYINGIFSGLGFTLLINSTLLIIIWLVLGFWIASILVLSGITLIPVNVWPAVPTAVFKVNTNLSSVAFFSILVITLAPALAPRGADPAPPVEALINIGWFTYHGLSTKSVNSPLVVNVEINSAGTLPATSGNSWISSPALYIFLLL